MATINKPKPKNYTPNPHTKEATIKKVVYNTTLWRRLRQSQLMICPLCEICGDLATEVHHIQEISNGTDENEMMKLGFDTANLMSLCRKCHHKQHNKKKTN